MTKKGSVPQTFILSVKIRDRPRWPIPVPCVTFRIPRKMGNDISRFSSAG